MCYLTCQHNVYLTKEVNWWRHLLHLLTSVKVVADLSHYQSDGVINHLLFFKRYHWYKFQVRAMKHKILGGLHKPLCVYWEAKLLGQLSFYPNARMFGYTASRVFTSVTSKPHCIVIYYRSVSRLSKNLFKKSSKEYIKLSMILEKSFS